MKVGMNRSVEQQLTEYMKRPYTVVLRADEDGDVIARVAELEGCVAHGSGSSEALQNLEVVKRLWLTAALKASKTIPEPAAEADELPSGKWVQRVPRSLHKQLTEIAKTEGTSLNSLVQSYLSAAVAGRNSVLKPEVCVAKPARGAFINTYRDMVAAIDISAFATPHLRPQHTVISTYNFFFTDCNSIDASSSSRIPLPLIDMFIPGKEMQRHGKSQETNSYATPLH